MKFADEDEFRAALERVDVGSEPQIALSLTDAVLTALQNTLGTRDNRSQTADNLDTDIQTVRDALEEMEAAW